MKKSLSAKYRVTFVIFALLITAVFFVGISWNQKHRIVDVQKNVVAYADGTAEFISADDTPDQVTHVYRAKIPAIPVENSEFYIVPTFIFQGGAWQREVYTYNDPESENCSRNILYKDRVNKLVKQSRIDYCIQMNATLDGHDITHFFATSSDGISIAVGAYENGNIVASHDVPEGMFPWKREFSWDLTRGIVTFVSATDCGPDTECAALQPKPQAFYWNLQTGEWREVEIPQYTAPIDSDNSGFVYNVSDDAFDYSARLTVGEVNISTPSTVDKVTRVE